MKFELNDQETELLQDAVEAAVGHLSEQIACTGLPDRQALRERRVMLRAVGHALITGESH
jgi:hypothetical protein